MNITKITLFFILTLLVNIKSYSQVDLETYTNVLPLSPSASSLGTYGQVPVGMFTGTAQFNIPLYELNSQKLSVPIALNYSTNGVRVDQVASWVGMSWSLSAGGVITRVVRDRADEKSTRISLENIKELWQLDYYQTEQITLDPDNEEIDTEPDLYSYNFNGQSGKFIIDTDGFPRLIPHQDVNIEVIGTGGIRTFEITTKDGVRYYFGESSNSVEKTRSQSSCADGQNGIQDFYTAWYLTRIVHPTGDVINFTYAKDALAYNSGVQQTYSNGVYDVNCSDCSAVTGSDICTSEITIGVSRLIELSTDNILVKFESSFSTSEAGYRLDSMLIEDKESAITEHQFNFNYIYSNNTTRGSSKSSATATNRLFLDNIVETGTDITSPKQYSFSYDNIDNLPKRLSFSQDHWGYYNGATNSNFVHLPANLSSYFSGFTGADREPDFNYAKYGSLNKITYPTGGTTIIEYEAHEYWDIVTSQNIETGGIRVKLITSTENDNATPIKERYFYTSMDDLVKSSATIPDIPNYHSITTFSAVDNSSAFLVNCTVHNLSSNSNTFIYNVSGSHIAYHSVLKSYGENFENGGEYFEYVAQEDEGGVIFQGSEVVPGSGYTNSGWNSGMLLEQKSFKKDGSGGFTILKEELYNYNFQPYVGGNPDVRNSDTITAGVIRLRHSRNYTGPLLPLLPRVTCTAYDILEKTWTGWECTTSHKHIWASDPSTDGWKCFSLLDGGPNNIKIYYNNPCSQYSENQVLIFSGFIGHYDVSLYDIIIRWQYLKQKTIKQYDDDGLNPISTTIDYQYDNVLHSQISKTTTTNSKGDIIVQKTYYPLDYDYSNLTEFQTLVENYINGIPIDLRQETNSKLTSGQLLKYNDDGQVTEILQADTELGTTLAFSNTNPYSYGDRKVTINYNATTGNISEFNKEEDVSSVYLWSYNNTYPVAKIQNATVAEVTSAMNSVSSTFIGGLGANTNQISISLRLNQLRTYLASGVTSDAMITTYMYDPLKGLIMQTGPNGINTHYQYDDLGRMKAVLNNDQEVVQYINYNYQSDPEINLSISTYNFGGAGGSKAVSVTSNRNWTASESVSWLSISGGSGTNDGSFTITATNNTGSARTAIVTVTADGISKTISISQDEAYSFVLDGDRNSLKTSYYYNSTISSSEESKVDEYYGLETGDDGLQIEVYISTNGADPDPVSFTVEYDNNASSWIDPYYSSYTNKLDFETEDPENGDVNYASINMTSFGITKIVSVKFDSDY